MRGPEESTAHSGSGDLRPLPEDRPYGSRLVAEARHGLPHKPLRTNEDQRDHWLQVLLRALSAWSC